MIEWNDRAIVLSARPQGEDAVVASLLTTDHGRHGGVVRGGQGRRLRATLEPGTLVQAHWKARLEDHLGTLTLEPLAGVAGLVLSDRDRLAALASSCALAEVVLPDRAPHPEVFDGLLLLLDSLAHGDDHLDWAGALARWELALLAAVGFGLDLTQCAVTGVTEGLTHVSPRSGRAVCREAAGPWLSRLLPMPAFLLEPEGRPQTGEEVTQALALTGHFLEVSPLLPPGKRLPLARRRLVDRLARWALGS
ncbi:DNA repair protein RecO [Rhodospirillum sp. A1_3_36]|uniref:DNA repair protein RecO n=1 Tax=Rhodospirillum sp. A1_3_36 TaxID=3391666 RepID=UPI0039A59EE8